MDLSEAIEGKSKSEVFYGTARVSNIDTTTTPDTYTANAGSKVFRIALVDDGETVANGDTILVLKIGRVAFGLGKLRNS